MAFCSARGSQRVDRVAGERNGGFAAPRLGALEGALPILQLFERAHYVDQATLEGDVNPASQEAVCEADQPFVWILDGVA
jgi:hypothetical protein